MMCEVSCRGRDDAFPIPRRAEPVAIASVYTASQLPVSLRTKLSQPKVERSLPSMCATAPTGQTTAPRLSSRYPGARRTVWRMGVCRVERRHTLVHVDCPFATSDLCGPAAEQARKDETGAQGGAPAMGERRRQC